MEYEVSAEAAQIDFGATGLDEINQNVLTILTTWQGSVPLDRSFGIDAPMDQPQAVIEARMTNRILRALRQYEPRITVIKIRYEYEAMNGRIKPIIRYRLADGVMV